MKISTRTRYGLRLMVALAVNYGKGALLLKNIAKDQDISEKYLSQIIIPLRTAGLVNSLRGAYGGYALAKKPSLVTAKDIIEVFEGRISLVACVKNPSCCNRAEICVTRDVWGQLSQQISHTLEETNLAQLADRYNENNSSRDTYKHIKGGAYV